MSCLLACVNPFCEMYSLVPKAILGISLFELLYFFRSLSIPVPYFFNIFFIYLKSLNSNFVTCIACNSLVKTAVNLTTVENPLLSPTKTTVKSTTTNVEIFHQPSDVNQYSIKRKSDERYRSSTLYFRPAPPVIKVKFFPVIFSSWRKNYSNS